MSESLGASTPLQKESGTTVYDRLSVESRITCKNAIKHTNKGDIILILIAKPRIRSLRNSGYLSGVETKLPTESLHLCTKVEAGPLPRHLNISHVALYHRPNTLLTSDVLKQWPNHTGQRNPMRTKLTELNEENRSKHRLHENPGQLTGASTSLCR